jgi:hypothetical protein
VSELNRFFVGFDTLEALLAVHRPDTPLYFTVRCLRCAADSHGCRLCMTYILVSDVQDGIARLWHMTIGQHLELGSGVLDRKLFEQNLQRADAADRDIRAFLRTRCGCDVPEAAVAVPEALRLSEGSTQLFEYDPSTQRYVFKGAAAEGAGAPTPGGAPVDGVVEA